MRTRVMRQHQRDSETAAQVHMAAAEAKAELRLALLHLERAMDKAAEVLSAEQEERGQHSHGH